MEACPELSDKLDAMSSNYHELTIISILLWFSTALLLCGRFVLFLLFFLQRVPFFTGHYKILHFFKNILSLKRLNVNSNLLSLKLHLTCILKNITFEYDSTVDMFLKKICPETVFTPFLNISFHQNAYCR